jgi:FkbM family methyltransferase
VGRIPLFGGRYDLPYCGRTTPFPSDYFLPVWAPYVLTPLRPLFPGTFVDVGSNIGQTLLLIKDSDPNWDYIGFEPNPNSFLISQQIAKVNAIQRCQLVPVGLSDQAGVLEMESNFDTDPASSVVSGFRARGRMKLRSHIAVLRGDEALASIPCDRVGIVKIDVEGGELEVLRGLRGCLEASRPLVVCEVLALHDDKSVGNFRVHRQRAIERILLEQKFSIFRIEPPRTARFVPEVPDDGNRDLTDYLFVPDERKSEFAAALTSEGFLVI